MCERMHIQDGIQAYIGNLALHIAVDSTELLSVAVMLDTPLRTNVPRVGDTTAMRAPRRDRQLIWLQGFETATILYI